MRAPDDYELDYPPQRRGLVVAGGALFVIAAVLIAAVLIAAVLIAAVLIAVSQVSGQGSREPEPGSTAVAESVQPTRTDDHADAPAAEQPAEQPAGSAATDQPTGPVAGPAVGGAVPPRSASSGRQASPVRPLGASPGTPASPVQPGTPPAPRPPLGATSAGSGPGHPVHHRAPLPRPVVAAAPPATKPPTRRSAPAAKPPTPRSVPAAKPPTPRSAPAEPLPAPTRSSVAAPDAVPPLAAPPASPKVTKPPPPAVAVVPSPAGGPVSVDIPEQPSRRPVRVGMVNGTRCVTITETSSSEAGLASRQVTRCTSGAAADAGRSVPVSGHPESRSGCPCTAGAHTGTSDTGEQDTGEQPNGRRTKTNAKSKIGATGHDDDAPPVDAEEADPGATD